MRIFLKAVKFVAKLLNYDFFCCAEEDGMGYVTYSNSGSKVIRKFVDASSTIQVEWMKMPERKKLG